jgi:hypothetical protein
MSFGDMFGTSREKLLPRLVPPRGSDDAMVGASSTLMVEAMTTFPSA